MTLFTFAERFGVDEGTVLAMGCLLLGIFMPTVFFFAYQIYKRRFAMPIKVRYPGSTFWFTTFYCIKLGVSGTILLLLWNDQRGFPTTDLYQYLLVLDNVFLYAFFCFMIWRLWKIKYDLSWNKATLQDEAWRAIINESEQQSSGYGKQSWYFSHKATCCCPGPLFPLLLLIIVIVGVNLPVLLSKFLGFDTPYDSPLTIFISRCIFTGMVVIMIILYFLTPKKIGGRIPNFQLNKELRAVFIINLVIVLVCAAGFVFDLYYVNQFNEFAEQAQRNVNVLIEESLYFARMSLISYI